MKPSNLRMFASFATCLSVVCFFFGCASPKNDGAKLTSLDRPLYNAALRGDTNVVRALLDKGANPNATFWTGARAGETSVHAATRRRNIETLIMLVDHGGNLFKEGPGFGVPYLTPFEASVMEIEPPGPVTDMLIEAGAKPKKNGESPIATAGTYWAAAFYKERHGDLEGVLQVRPQRARP